VSEGKVEIAWRRQIASTCKERRSRSDRRRGNDTT
jgi:hypothetical protein